ncbi:P2X purinoceptor 7-like [Rhopilema esculentum]|uniref:P2X purinoceptor 7-like n=1 Tax=Rhopilema esculentum TaxID=499914 RepID=UPI0031D14F38|eukprot:gene17758-9430_t
MADSQTDFDYAENNSLEIVPYQFEPLVQNNYPNTITETSSSEDDLENGGTEEEHPSGRIGNTEWCKCGSCVSMDKAAEAICCREIEAVENLLGEEGVNCITAHSGFRSCCLNMHSVRVAIEIYSQYVGPFDGTQPPHETYRHVAYRQLARFLYGHLGRHNRRVHPSCAVAAIRRAFPGQSYAGF